MRGGVTLANARANEIRLVKEKIFVEYTVLDTVFDGVAR